MEIEVKFLLSNRSALIGRLQGTDAVLESPRTHELNLRFDTPDRALTQTFQALRLRQDAKVRVTYKGPGKMDGGVRARQEIEFAVDDFDAAKAMFEALGYEVSFIYEKYRTTYHLDNVEIVLDETPLGIFTEIEGPDAEAIQLASDRLGLNWEARINDSYVYLFETVKRSLALPYRDLTFDNFKEIEVLPKQMKVVFGDRE